MNLAPFFGFKAATTWTPTFKAEQAKYIDRTIGRLGDLYPVAGMIGRRYAETASRRNYVIANQELRELAVDAERLRRHDLNLTATDEVLSDWAQAKAKAGAELVSQAERTDNPEKLAGIVASVFALAARYQFDLPDPEDVGILPAIRRAADAAWWRRQARRAAAQECERMAIALRRVNKAREIYCSNLTVTRRQAQRVRNRRYLEATTATNEEGQSYTLAELSDVSVSNPRLMRVEWMTRVGGFDEVALLMGHCRELWTLTAPAEFHPWTTAGGGLRENKKFVDAGKPTPRIVMDHHCRLWAGFRAFIGRRGVRLYGMRVVEANHDGTPHWHMAVYFDPAWPGVATRAAAHRLHAIFRRYALGDMSNYSADEKAAAKKHRVDFMDVMPGKSAAGYLAKYIAKALPADDAADMVQNDLFGNAMGESVQRVNAWASCWRIRQFQQIGGPSVQVWRELRRAMSSEAAQLDLLDAPQAIQEAAAAADEHDWAAFVLAMGGPTVGRGAGLIGIGYWHEHDADTGEVKGRALTRYGEVPDARIYGVTWSGGELLTRVHTWDVAATKPAAPIVVSDRNIARESRDTIRKNPPEWKPWAVALEFEFPDVPRVVRETQEKLPPPWRFSVLRRTAPPLESCQ